MRLVSISALTTQRQIRYISVLQCLWKKITEPILGLQFHLRQSAAGKRMNHHEQS